MAGVIHQDRKRLSVRRIDAQDRDGGVDGRGRDFGGITPEHGHGPVRVHAAPVVADISDSAAGAQSRVDGVLARLIDGRLNLFEIGGLPGGDLARRVPVLDHGPGVGVRSHDYEV